MIVRIVAGDRRRPPHQQLTRPLHDRLPDEDTNPRSVRAAHKGRKHSIARSGQLRAGNSRPMTRSQAPFGARLQFVPSESTALDVADTRSIGVRCHAWGVRRPRRRRSDGYERDRRHVRRGMERTG